MKRETISDLRLQMQNAAVLHAAAIDDLQKKVKSAETSCSYQYKQAQQMSAEISAMHSLLDNLPNPPLRKANPADGAYSENLSLSTRLAVWLAGRGRA